MSSKPRHKQQQSCPTKGVLEDDQVDNGSTTGEMEARSTMLELLSESIT